MSGHRRFSLAAFLLFAGLSTVPAFSDPISDLFNPAPKEATAPVAAQEACVLQPGRSTTPGQRWVYHFDGRHRCWFQTADKATASVKKRAYHRIAKQPVVARDENEDEAAPRKNTALDARAQLLNTAPAEPFQSAVPAPQLVDTAPAASDGAATFVPEAPVAAQPTIDQLAADRATQHSVEAKMLLAATSPAKDPVAFSAPVAIPVAPSIPDTDGDHWELMATRAGVVLITVGLIFLIGSLLADRFLDQKCQ